MKALLITLLAAPVFCIAQDAAPPPQTEGQDQAQAQAQTQAAQQDGEQKNNEAQRSVIQVKPSSNEVIKNKDLWEKTGYWHPFVRMPKYILQDQRNIWTSPAHTAKSDIKWWVIFGSATAALIATDKNTEKNTPSNSTWTRVGTDASYLGSAQALIPISAGFYFLGTAKGSERFRETGLLAFEALIDSTLVEVAIKTITDRARPLESDGKGHFEDSTSGRWTSGFPSGHAINTFALASVFSHEYPHKWWLQAIIYGYGAGVMGARLAAKRHFPGDVFAGGVMGWFIGDYVYGKRHNPELNGIPPKSTVAQKVLSHVSLGGGLY